MKLKQPIILALIALSLFSCKSENPYQLSATNIGPLTQDATVEELDVLFSNDSVVDQASNMDQEAINAIEIYEKGGNQLLSLIPASTEKLSKIKTIQVFDPRYTTAKGIGLKSTFGEIRQAYTIDKIQTLISSVVIFVNEINAYFTIDRSELASELQFDLDAKIEAAQIPDQAKVKFFMIGWDAQE